MANTPTIVQRNQEGWASFKLSRPKFMFIWAKEDLA